MADGTVKKETETHAEQKRKKTVVTLSLILVIEHFCNHFL